MLKKVPNFVLGPEKTLSILVNARRVRYEA